MKLACAPSMDLSSELDDDVLPVLLFARPESSSVASAGAAALEVITKQQLRPTRRAWDLLSIALSVVTADTAVLTGNSADGWTREIEISIAVWDVDFWTSQRDLVQQLLRFLTSDLWAVDFTKGRFFYEPHNEPLVPANDCVSLLSGGLDSLVGAIDLAACGKQPFVVSQVAQGDKDRQVEFASEIGGGLRHLQLTHNATVPGATEDSQRARSIAFLAYGVLAATTLQKYRDKEVVTLYVCENGFISINPPFTDMRIGSLSTRTTHPTYIGLFQRLLDNSGLRVRIENPYQFHTKGRMMRDCADQDYLLKAACCATSCGRYGRHYQHCGRCVPCLIRRAAFFEWRHPDTTSYRYEELGKKHADYAHFDDVRAAAMAIAAVEADGIDRWVGAQLSSKFIQDPQPYLELIELGICELAMFLKDQGVT